MFLSMTSLVLGYTGETRAEPTRHPVGHGRQHVETRWYGAPIIVSDCLALSIVGVTMFSTERTGTLVGGTAAGLVYLAGGPLVHASEREFEHLAGSLGLRLLPLAVGGPLVYFNQNDRDMREVTVGAFILAGGGLAAMAVDIAALAWKSEATSGAFVTIVPSQTAEGSPLVNVAGRF